jgi:hypothetical protein
MYINFCSKFGKTSSEAYEKLKLALRNETAELNHLIRFPSLKLE